MRFSVKLSILFSFLTLLTGAVIAYIVHVTNTAVLEAHIAPIGKSLGQRTT